MLSLKKTLIIVPTGGSNSRHPLPIPAFMQLSKPGAVVISSFLPGSRTKQYKLYLEGYPL